jgi:hypothetical protein
MVWYCTPETSESAFDEVHGSNVPGELSVGRRRCGFRYSTHIAPTAPHRMRWLDRQRAHSCARVPRLLLLPILARQPGLKLPARPIQLLPLQISIDALSYLQDLAA